MKQPRDAQGHFLPIPRTESAPRREVIGGCIGLLVLWHAFLVFAVLAVLK